MSIPHTACSLLGYHTLETMPGESIVSSKSHAPRNWINIAGYFPLIGAGIAIIRVLGLDEHEERFKATQASPMGHTSSDLPMPTSYKVMVYVRAFFEAIGAGVIFLLVDIIASLIRFSPCADKRDYRVKERTDLDGTEHYWLRPHQGK